MSKQEQISDEYLDDDGNLVFDGWREAVLDGILLGQECDECGHVTGSPKAACPDCGNRDIEVVQLPETGEVYSETTINVPPEGFEERGYEIAVVQLGDARVLGRSDDDLDIGDEVEFTGAEEIKGEDPAVLFEKK
ncbi:MAG: zinc ribbon domain-containing protein [Halobacteria archaeon]|nr:zinc ribbon domain-containing protein [Halobacteria archaeon]